MRFSVVSALAFCGLAAAGEMSIMERQVATITTVLSNIQSITEALDTAINGWTGGDPSPILQGSQKLIDATTQGTDQVNAATAISTQDALVVQKVVQTLQKVVEKTVGDLSSKKQQISQAKLGGEAYKQLVQQYNGAKAISSAISSKVPPALASIAVQLSQGILTAVQKGVDSFADIKDQVNPNPVAGSSSGSSSAGPAAGGAAAGAGASAGAGAAGAGAAGSSGSATNGTATNAAARVSNAATSASSAMVAATSNAAAPAAASTSSKAAAATLAPVAFGAIALGAAVLAL